jgi:hypothetical protein
VSPLLHGADPSADVGLRRAKPAFAGRSLRLPNVIPPFAGMTRIRFDGCDLSPERGTPVCQSYHRQMAARLLKDAWPEIVGELRSALLDEEEVGLAESIESLQFLPCLPVR